MSQGALGQASGITFQQIQKYEKRMDRISVSRLVHLGAGHHDGAEPFKETSMRSSGSILGPPGMLLRGVAVADDRFQAAAIEGAEGNGDTGAHAPDSHAPNPSGIPPRIQSSDLIH